MATDRFSNQRIRDPLHDPEGGATATEYGLIAALIAVAAIAAMEGISGTENSSNAANSAYTMTSARAAVSFIRQDGRPIPAADERELDAVQQVCREAFDDDREYVACATQYVRNVQNRVGGPRLEGVSVVAVN